MKYLLLFLLISFPLLGKEVTIIHTPITMGYSSIPVDCTLTIPDPSAVKQVYLLVRQLGVRKYTKITMQQQQHRFWGRIPKQYVAKPGFEYFIVYLLKNGTILNGVGNKWEPITARVRPPKPGMISKSQAAYQQFLQRQEKKASVVSAGKRAQDITESAATISVLGTEEIQRTGARKITDLFQMVPGVDRVQIGSGDSIVSMRGLNQVGTGRIVTLIDGRPISNQLLGVTLWEMLPIDTTDIERIEFIRGPASVLYGGNAFNGAINIITKQPEKRTETVMVGTAGDYGITQNLVVTGGKGDLRYRVSAGYQEYDQFDNATEGMMKQVKASSSLYYTINNDHSWTLHSGFFTGHVNQLMTNLGPMNGEEISEQYIHSIYHYKGFQSSLLFRKGEVVMQGGFSTPKYVAISDSNQNTVDSPISLPFTFIPLDLSGDLYTIKGDIQYDFLLGDIDQLQIGIGYNFQQIDTPQLQSASYGEHQISAFIRNDLTLGNLIINAGVRGDMLIPDYHSNFRSDYGDQKQDLLSSVSGQGSIIYRLSTQTFRLSSGAAFRNPNYIESGMKGVILSSDQGDLMYEGNGQLAPERVISIEGAYGLTALQRRLSLNLNLYYNIYNDLILFGGDFNRLINTAMGNLQESSVDLFNVDNSVDLISFGGEFSCSYYINRYVTISASYAYQKIDLQNENDLLTQGYNAITDVTTIHLETPEHQGSVSATLSAGIFSLNIMGSYRSQTTRSDLFSKLDQSGVIQWGENSINMSNNANSVTEIDPWMTLNVHFMASFLKKRLTIGFVGRDLLGGNAQFSKTVSSINNQSDGISSGKHIEYPRSQLFGNVIGGETLGRSFYGYLSLRF